MENSGAQLYVKPVGFVQRSVPGTGLGTVLAGARSDTVIQTARTNLGAAAVYHDSTADGCGVAFLEGYRMRFNMVASGSLSCGTNVMRHEFGHNMGLNHGGATGDGDAPFGRGFGGASTVMAGNGNPFYSSPNLYTYELGIRMGIENDTDAVRAINMHAPSAAALR
nr:zinc-dependent metalloprotease family protein [Roseateles koreensis]